MSKLMTSLDEFEPIPMIDWQLHSYAPSASDKIC